MRGCVDHPPNLSDIERRDSIPRDPISRDPIPRDLKVSEVVPPDISGNHYKRLAKWRDHVEIRILRPDTDIRREALRTEY